MATVKDVLGLPILSQAQVVAGNSGLERPVRLVHVVDIPDITQWILPQMLLMTTGYSRFQWTSIIGELDAQKLSGIMVALGPYIQEIPDEALADADRLGLPIIVLPWALPFVRVSEAVHQLVIQEQFAVMANIDRLQTQMVRVAVQSRSLTQLCQDLSSLCGHAVDVTDSEGNSLLNRAIPMAAFTQFPIQTFHAHTHFLRVALPQPLEDWQTHVFEHMALVTGLWVLREQVAARTEARLQSSVLDMALSGNVTHDPGLVERAKLIGFHMHRRHHLLVVAVVRTGPCKTKQGFEPVTHVEDQLRHVLSEWKVLTTLSQEYIVAVLPEQPAISFLSLNHKIHRLLSENGCLTAVFSDAVETTKLAETYRAIIRVMPRTARTEVMDLSSLLFPRLIAELPPEVMGTLVKLTWDRITDPVLRLTLQVLVEHHGSRSEAAMALRIHRNTLRYRVQQLEQILERPLDPGYLWELGFMFRWIQSQAQSQG
ncbi:MAG: hypothetical protein C7B44_09150 [Sulfobacillus thermosulfidooxidans]|nr:MAG: hypothetical protein C7B44_09150 [Sulfobacillus thermosulfidooxidans]